MTKLDYKLSDVVVKNTGFLNQKVIKRSSKNSYGLILCNPLCKPR